MKINKIFNRVLLLGALAMTMTACDKDVFDINADPFKDQTFITELYDPTSIEIEKDGRFTEYTRALYYADMYNALNQYGQKYTAFVPTDSAMVEFYKSRGVTALEQLPASYVKEFIKCHTHNGDSLLPEKFIMKNTIDNMCGDELSIEIDSVNPGQALLGGAAQIIEMGKSASNGKIYVITSTLTPLVETVYDRVVEQGKSTVMIDALNATGWAKKLQTVEDTTKIDGITTITRHFYTLLNVEDNVFAKALQKKDFNGIKIQTNAAGQLIIDVFIDVYNDISAPDLCFKVQENIRNSIIGMVDVKPEYVNVHIVDVHIKPEGEVMIDESGV